MVQSPLPRAVSTWSLHRTLGNFVADNSAIGGGPFMRLPEAPQGMSLLEMIPELSRRGYSIVQICHFHLESQEPEYLESVKSSLETHDITLDMLLVDDGDLSAATIEPQLAWYESWLESARILGANRARICAGRSNPSAELLERSGKYLAQLAENHPQVRIVTENWMEMTPDAASVLSVLDAAGDGVGLLIDLANWHGPEKYEQLALIADRAESCHAKCVFTEDGPDEEDFRKTLGVLKGADFNGPLALIYDGPDPDEWASLETEWNIARSVLD